MEDIRIKYASCWDVLDDLKVDKSKVFVILSKYDNISTERKIEEIANDLKISNPIAISSRTGYGIHKLKTIIGHSALDKLKN
jgi:GTP-binding protein HflX